jgi:UDP-glucuronate 4-epimerase
MRALVTGGAGFIGSRLSVDLMKTGYEVLAVDALRPYYSPELKSLRISELLAPEKVQFMESDLTDFDSLHEIVKDFKPTTIFHLAAQPGVRVPVRESNRYIQDNLVAHSNVMKTAVINGIPNVLYASSSSIYGNGSKPPYSESELSLKPVSLYGSTKLSNEIISTNFVKGSATRVRGLRFFTVYGPWGRPDMAYFRLIASALDGKEFLLFGDGQIRRDFTFVDDISNMTIKLDQQLAKMPTGTSDVVNIGGGAPHSMSDLINCIENRIEKKINIRYMDKNQNDTEYTIADTSLIQNLIGAKPEIKLEAGIERVINWASDSKINRKLRDWVNSSL